MTALVLELFVRIAAAYNTMAATRGSPWNQTEASGSGLQLFHYFLPSKLNVSLSPYKSFTWVANSFTTYLQSLTIRLEEMRIKRRGLGQRMHHKLHPHDLLEHVMRSVLMVGTGGVDERNIDYQSWRAWNEQFLRGLGVTKLIGDEGQDLISELNGGTTSTVCIGESSLKSPIKVTEEHRWCSIILLVVVAPVSMHPNRLVVPGDLLKQYQDIHDGTFVVTGNYLRE
ncbi:hypothetical protein Tco_0899275 [Tanacetum coccineum]